MERPSASAVASSASAVVRPDVTRRAAPRSSPDVDDLAELGGWPAVLGPLLAGRDLTDRPGPRGHGRDPAGHRDRRRSWPASWWRCA